MIRTLFRALLALVLVGLARPASAQLAGVPFTIQPSQASAIVNGTVTRNQVALPPCNVLDVLLNITGGGAATGSLTLFVQDTADGGTTWDDVISSNAFALGAAVITQRFIVNGLIASTIASGSAAVREALAAGTTRQGPFGNLLRVREVMAGIITPTAATYTITAVCK